MVMLRFVTAILFGTSMLGFSARTTTGFAPAALRQRMGSSARVRMAALAPSGTAPPLRTMYEATAPLSEGRLDVGGGHSLYFRTYGNVRGAPALFLHGGPGAGCFPNHARFFDPARYFVVLVDQRGCGASTPRGRLEVPSQHATRRQRRMLRQDLRRTSQACQGCGCLSSLPPLSISLSLSLSFPSPLPLPPIASAPLPSGEIRTTTRSTSWQTSRPSAGTSSSRSPAQPPWAAGSSSPRRRPRAWARRPAARSP